MSVDRCSKSIAVPGVWGHWQKCSRVAVRDGFCKQHHPDSVKARDEARRLRWEAKQKFENAPIETIKNLTAEIERLRGLLKEAKTTIVDLIDAGDRMRFLLRLPSSSAEMYDNARRSKGARWALAEIGGEG